MPSALVTSQRNVKYEGKLLEKATINHQRLIESLKMMLRMQTFLPFADFAASARVLDVRRLGKQRVENLQILSALIFPSYGWQHHPATNIWRGHAYALKLYHKAICAEWRRRGFRDTCERKFNILLEGRTFLSDKPPAIIGVEPFHASHRAALLHKDFAHYSRYNWPERPELNYVWKLPPSA